MKQTLFARRSMLDALKKSLIISAAHRLGKTLPAAFAVVCLFSSPHASAQKMTGIAADAQVGSTGSVSTTSNPMLAGTSGTTELCPVFVFQLPALPAGQGFATATFDAYYDGKDGAPAFNGDLYGLPARSSSNVLAADYYAGSLDATATLLQDNYAYPTLGATGAKLYCSNPSIVSYLNAQYQAGGAGKYVFLRVSPDQVLGSGTTRYRFSSAEEPGGSYYWPTITYTTAPLSYNVAMGGGGAVTGIIADPTTSGRFYMRTDVGGAFRWDASAASWTPITESFSYSDGGNDFGINSLVPDPNTAGTLYAYTGKYDYSSYTSHIYKSVDAGQNWTTLPTPSGLRGSSNQGDHSRCGEKLGVDPNNSDVLYLASYNIGLQKYSNASNHWTPVMQSGTTPFPKGETKLGLSFVVFDKGGGTTGGGSSIIYVGVVDTTGGTGGVWKTTDGGANWSLMNGGFMHPARGRVASDGTFYATFNNNGGVCKASRTATALTNCAPNATIIYGGLAVDPTNPQTVYVSRSDASYNTATYVSTNGGSTWTAVGSVKGAAHLATRDNTQWFGHIAQLAINPFNTTEVWMADWRGVLQTVDITNTATPWNYLYAGHEETVPLSLCSAPSGAPLLSGVADVNGLAHLDVDQYPANSFVRTSTPTSFGSTTGLDFCEANTNAWARVNYVGGGGGAKGYYSTDDGQSWTSFPSTPASTGGRIAVSATNSNNLVWMTENGNVYYTTNRGSTWTESSPVHPGGPGSTTDEFDTTEQALASNRVTGGCFYLYQPGGATGKIWRSTDGGATWAVLSTVSTNTASTPPVHRLKARPGFSGELWLAVGGVGVFKSTNGGTSFVAQTGFSNATSVAFGAPPSGQTGSTIFVWGTLNGTASYYRSDDGGSSWVNAKDPNVHTNDQADFMEADRQTFGRFYIGTNGRGTYVIDSN